MREQLILSCNAVFNSGGAQTSYYRKMKRSTTVLEPATSDHGVREHGRHLLHRCRLTCDPGSGEKVFTATPRQRAGRRRGRWHSHFTAHQRARSMERRRLLPARNPTSLENHYKDMQDFEFTVGRHPVRCRPATAILARRGESRDRHGRRKFIDEDRCWPRCSCTARSLLHLVFDTASPKKLTARHRHRRISRRSRRSIAFSSEDAVEMSARVLTLIRKERH